MTREYYFDGEDIEDFLEILSVLLVFLKLVILFR